MERAAIGILMLDTAFPRPPGDIGNVDTWDFPVILRAVSGASANKVVHEDPSELFQAFVDTGRALIDEGCAGLTTSCGFLSLMQDDLKNALGVPFASSPLMQIPMIQATLPAAQEVGVLTISKESLSPDHLRAAGVKDAIPIEGLPSGGAFASAIFGDAQHLDTEACQQEMIETAERLISGPVDIGALVLECTNMAPYAAAIERATGRPVFSVVSFLNWFQAGLRPTCF